jgi:hypothetical protein
MKSDKVKLLTNYQLFQLSHNEHLDRETLSRLKNEISSRNISEQELNELKQQYDETFIEVKGQIDASIWNPFYTAFAWKRHLRQIALLKTFGTKPEVSDYQIKFYTGLFVYMLIFIILLLLGAV